MHGVYTKIVLGSYQGKDKKYPVQIRVTYKIPRVYNVKYKGKKVRMTKEEFASTQKTRFTKTEKEAKRDNKRRRS